MELMYLKSGTDIRGTALGDSVQLTDGAIERISFGFLRFLQEKTGIKSSEMTVCIGHDSRISAERIICALVRVLCAQGVRVRLCGLCSTPAMFTVNLDTDCTASIQVTASHHPYDRNGLKFFTRDGGFDGKDIEKILRYAEDVAEDEIDAVNASCGKNEPENFDYMPQYCEMLREMIKREINAPNYSEPLKGLHIVVDAGNGAGGFFANDVLMPLGADISGSEFLEPDGTFPNHIPNPENETAMGFICRSVLKNGADLGVIFDTDVDRAACVGKNGREINRNALIALAAYVALKDSPGGTVVTDSVTSDGLKKFIEQTLGGVHYRYKRGYKNVINKAEELNKAGIDCPLAIETSGHAALRENRFLDDGAYLMTKIIILLARLKHEGRELTDLLSELEEPEESMEIRYKINADNFREYGERVIDGLKAYCADFPFITPAEDNYDGFRISFDSAHGGGWLLLRMSVHDPVLPINIESSQKGGLSKIKEFLDGFISGFDCLSLM